jgi:HAD superfamily hydrolase (TIGR01549 family)
MASNTVQAIIWDYDGTLVDTRKKNLNVTRQIVGRVAGVDPLTFDALRSQENYASVNRRSRNWRDLYIDEFGFTEEQTDSAGRLWTEYQLKDATPTPMYDGIQHVVAELRDFRNGIVSQNSQSTIFQVLQENDLLRYFRLIVGYEEVDLRKQKPHPEGLLMCIEKLTPLRSGCVLYVGDHATDIECARNANVTLHENGSKLRVVSIGAAYSSDGSSPEWPVPPDHEARNVRDLVDIVQSYQ